MAIFTRFVNVIRANLNAMLNRAEDPSKMIEQTLVDLDSAYRQAKEQVAKAVADQKRLEKSLFDEQKQIKLWQERAMAAVQKNDDGLAREALRRKTEHQNMVAQFEQEHHSHSANVDQLKQSLRDLETKISEIKRKKNLLVSKQRRAEAQTQIYQTIDGMKGGGALDTIGRMEEKIESMSAMADARQQISDEFSGDALEDRFKALSSGGNVENELLEMKKQMQLEQKPS